MIRVAMIARSTLYSVRGGDTVQLTQTAEHLRRIGVLVDIKLTHEPIDYRQYSLLHFFNIIRPADILYHVKKARKPFVVSTIFVDYSGYDRTQRKGVAGALFRTICGERIEYCKTIARKLLGRDSLRSFSYVWKGHRKSIINILQRADHLLPNSQHEYTRLEEEYGSHAPYTIITNGIHDQLFPETTAGDRDRFLVICVARIEGVKNQLNLIKALNGTHFRLWLIGTYAPNQFNYYRQCRRAAGDNISFLGHVEQEKLVDYYRLAKVHVLPSWFETTGLSSLEAAAMGCNIVITGNGDAKEYFGDHALYCDPASPASIRNAIEKASVAGQDISLQQKIRVLHTWQRAAHQTRTVYEQVITRK